MIGFLLIIKNEPDESCLDRCKDISRKDGKMPRLKDRNKQTPGGHKFYDPILKYRSQPWASVDQIAAGLIQAREGNPAMTQQHGWSTDFATVCNEVDEAIARQCQQMGWNSYIVAEGGGGQPPSNFQRPQSQRFLGKLRSVVGSGSPVIIDFIKSKEEAVPIKVATERAQVCLQCPYNLKAKSLLDIFTTSASEAIRKGLEQLRGWNLSVPNSEGLSVCEICQCPLKLKVFIPLEQIKSKMSDEVRYDLPEWCWIIKSAE